MKDYLRIFGYLGTTSFIFYGGLSGCSQTPQKDEPIELSQSRQYDEKVSEQTDNQLSKLTENEIQNLLKFWENAQDAEDFEGYQRCCAKPFKGVKTTSKGSKEYSYAEWMIDRRKMLEKAVGLDVEIKNVQISLDGETAIVEFDQYYRSKNYSDWGPKVLKVKQTPGGAKIVYELLKASYPL